MMKRTIYTVVTAALAVVVGCQDPVRMGTVVRTPELRARNGDIAPDIPVRSAHGEDTRTLDRIGYPFYVVAFVEPPAGGACYVNGHLRTLASRLTLDSVVVAQVVEPTPQAPLTDRPASRCPVPEPDTLVVLYDPDQLAWEAFGRPAMGSVFLVDRHDAIVATGTTTNLARIEIEADRLQREWETDYEDDRGGYMGMWAN